MTSRPETLGIDIDDADDDEPVGLATMLKNWTALKDFKTAEEKAAWDESVRRCIAFHAAAKRPPERSGADRLRAWETRHAPTIGRRQDERRKRIEDQVADLLYMLMRDQSMTKNVAGDHLLSRWSHGYPGLTGGWTPPELKAALIALGWVPPRQRRKGGAE